MSHPASRRRCHRRHRERLNVGPAPVAGRIPDLRSGALLRVDGRPTRERGDRRSGESATAADPTAITNSSGRAEAAP